MLKITWVISGLLCFVMNTVVAGTEMIRTEETIEAASLYIVLDASLNGHVIGALCDHCDKIRVVITPETIAIADSVPVPLIEAKKRAGKGAFVTFDAKTLKVTKIRW